MPAPGFWQRCAAYFGMSGSAECIAAASLFVLMIVFRIANMPSRPELLDCSNLQRVATAQYDGDAFAGELTMPVDLFSPEHLLFLKMQRRSWFFDEAGWLEVPSVRSRRVLACEGGLTEKYSSGIR
jgi:hypothetical protein